MVFVGAINCFLLFEIRFKFSIKRLNTEVDVPLDRFLGRSCGTSTSVLFYILDGSILLILIQGCAGGLLLRLFGTPKALETSMSNSSAVIKLHI